MSLLESSSGQVQASAPTSRPPTKDLSRGSSAFVAPSAAQHNVSGNAYTYQHNDSGNTYICLLFFLLYVSPLVQIQQLQSL